MAKKKMLTDAEVFVRRVLAKSFNQTIDSDTLRAVAEKVSQVVAEGAAPKKTPGAAKKKAA